jgi:translation initiation factor 2A
MATPMEIVALAKSGVQIYTFDGEKSTLSEKPDYTFPPVPTKEGCEWSPNGNLLGLANSRSGGVTVLNATDDYSVLCEVAPLVGGPVRNFYFSPLGLHLVTHERYVKDGGGQNNANVGVWDTKTGELKFSFILKSFTDLAWPPLKWTNLETHCCRMVHDGVLIMSGALEKDDATVRIDASNIMAFEVAPRGVGADGKPHVAICIAESKGHPAKCQIFRVDAPEKPTAFKSFFKAQKVDMMWNCLGTALLVKTSMEVDDTGKNYYGGTNLYFMRPDGQEDACVANADKGMVHDVQWSPVQDEFVLLHGDLPCEVAVIEGKKARKLYDMGSGHRNTIRFNNFGRFVAVGGYGQLLGDTEFWDRPGKKVLGSVRIECCVQSSWAPDGRHFMAATTAPRMRVDNKIVMYDYCGNLLSNMPFEELLAATFRPRSRGDFKEGDRPPSPGRPCKGGKGAAGTASAVGGKGGGSYPAAAPKPKAYVPPGARAGGRTGGTALQELLRSELGSTSANSTTSATKAFGVAQTRLPPGCAPPEAAGAAGGGAGRNARKKKAKDSSAEAEDKSAAVLAAALAPVQVSLPPKKAPAEEPKPAPAAAAAPSEENAEVEKKVRALRKKLAILRS